MSASDSSHFVQVLLPLPFYKTFTYGCEVALAPGTYVAVGFGSKKVYGVVWEETVGPTADFTIKSVDFVLDYPPMAAPLRSLIDWAARYYMTERGAVLKMALCLEAMDMNKKSLTTVKGEERGVLDHPFNLTLDQKNASRTIIDHITKLNAQPIVLQGVTGSGKTEVYFEAIQASLEMGGQSLILLPEIVLSIQWLERFEKRFGFTPTVWHSELTPARRRTEWRRIVEGKARVIVGARSALFLPYTRLGLVVVDEEHEMGYKQDAGVLYQTRDMAVMRASFEQIPVVLATATPSLETCQNVERGKYVKVVLGQRTGGAQLPTVELVDLKDKTERIPKSCLSQSLVEALRKNQTHGDQSLLFLNRRGYAPQLICGECGYTPFCKNCDAHLVYHKKDHRFKCHFCGLDGAAHLDCPTCSTTLISWGPGVERVAEDVSTAFPDARVLVMTSDHLTTSKKSEEAFGQIARGEVDIIIGTQIMAKGHHFPNLTLIGIIDGDQGLRGEDFRAAERTHHVLAQVSGRAGRAQKTGHVMIQTHMPEHPLMQALRAQDMEVFVGLEKEARRVHHFPPYGRLVAVVLSDRRAERAGAAARALAAHLPQDPHVTVWGPIPSYKPKLKGAYRWRFLVKTMKETPPQLFIQNWLRSVSISSSVTVRIDVDPYHFI